MKVGVQNTASDFVLETDRLRLRRFRPEDVGAVFAIIGDEVTMQYYPRTFDRSDAEQWVKRNLGRYAEYGHGLFAVTLKGNNEVIGDCGVIRQIVEGALQFEVGYHFRRDHWGNGYATEAARACMGMAFDALRAAEVISLIRPENDPSRRVAERNGMKREREVLHYNLPHLVYAMRRIDFPHGLKPSI